ncbi:MAG: hypothetical protein OXB97_01925, partial [Rhodospirillales bacterium]|nr:hypothetical protein [Rhodospirillales bacterium]
MSDSDGTETADTAMSRAFDSAGYTVPGIDASSEDERERRHHASPPGPICAHAALYRPNPGRDDSE